MHIPSPRLGAIRKWGFSNDVTPADRAAEAPAGGFMQAGWRSVTAGYFQAMGIPLLRGRVFIDADGEGHDQPVVITQSMAQRLWPNENAVGKRLFWGGTGGEPHTVVGVVGDIRDVRLDADPTPLMFLPYGEVPLPGMTLVIRSAAEPPAVAAAVRREIHAADPELPLPEVGSLSANRAAAVAEPRFRMLVLGGFAAAALLLASLGIYGVMALRAERRARRALRSEGGTRARRRPSA